MARGDRRPRWHHQRSTAAGLLRAALTDPVRDTLEANLTQAEDDLEQALRR